MAIIGFVAGAGWLQQQAALPPAAALLACGAALLLTLPLLRRRAWRPLPALAGGALLGAGWAAWLAAAALAPQLAPGDEGRDVTVVGVIDNLPGHNSQGIRFNFAVERVLAPDMAVPPHIALAWYTGFRGASQEVGDVRPGQRWQLTVRLQRPHGNANPGGFDYEVWLLEQGLRATGYVRPDRGNRLLADFVPGFSHLVEHCRAALRQRIERALPQQPYAGVIVALVVGDQRAIEQDDWKVFTRTGIGHLISISGLHITMVAGLFALALSALWRRSFFTGWQLPLLLPAQKVAALTGAAVALLYVLLAGFGVPAQRTLYMLTVVAAAVWFDRITSVSHVLCVALGVVVLLDPWAVLWPGFWLSFGAVAVLLYGGAGRLGRLDRQAADAGWRERLWRSLRLAGHTQYVVTCGLVPLTMLLFAQVSLVSPLANALAIPLLSLAVTPLALLGSVLPAPAGDWALLLAHQLVALLAQLLQWCSAGRLAVWNAPSPSWPVFVWALVGTLWLLAPRGWPLRWLGLASWIPLLSASPQHPPAGTVWLTVFDVGQGAAALLETSGHRLLVDSGPQYAPASNAGNRVLLPYFQARGIGALDAMVVTHSDTDHVGGALALLGGMDIAVLRSSLGPQHPVVRAARRHSRCEAGQGWEWDGVRFEMLHPLAASYADATLKPNARGCTLRVSAGGQALLLTADIEAPQEAELLARAPGQLRADVLLAPHHGSGTSSTPAFLAAVAPQLALFQVGYRNRYHHPKKEVFARYGQLGIERLRTDETGAITLELGPAIAVSAFRNTHARYWYGR